MSTSQILQRLYSLDTSLDFLDSLRSLIHHDEQEQYLISLQGLELARFVDFLDKVRAVPPAFHQSTKQIPQALGAIPTTENIARECLDKLQAICGYNAILPSSYILSDQIARVGDHPVALSGIADVWGGTYRGDEVSIKSLRVCMKDYQAIKKVCVLCDEPLSHLLNVTCASQTFSKEAIMWKRLRHPNIVPFIGVTTYPLQIISEWMPNGTLTEFVERNPDMNRIGLVSLPVTILDQ